VYISRTGLYSRPGNDLTYRFPLIVEALVPLLGLLHHRRGDSGVTSINRVRYRYHDDTISCTRSI
jgi:hypothetical protein